MPQPAGIRVIRSLRRLAALLACVAGAALLCRGAATADAARADASVDVVPAKGDTYPMLLMSMGA